MVQDILNVNFAEMTKGFDLNKVNWLMINLAGLVGLLGLLFSGYAMGLKPEEEVSLEKRLRPNQAQSVDDIARQIRQQHKWRILAAEPTVSDEKTFYRFKLLNKKRGRVTVVVIDPNEPNLKTLN